MSKARRNRRRRHPIVPPPRRATLTATPDPPPGAEVEVYPRVLSPQELGTDQDDTTLTAELAEQLRRIPACTHCGGRHLRACPRVKRMRFHANGALAAVDFWPVGKWDDADVIWPEEVADATG